MRYYQVGFSLIELMIAVAVIGILAAIALPNYTQYVMRSKRVAAQSEMLDIANRQQQYFMVNRAYADETQLGITLSTDVQPYYTVAVTPNEVLDASCASVSSTTPSFVITLTAIKSQANDGDLSLDNEGNKCPADKW